MLIVGFMVLKFWSCEKAELAFSPGCVVCGLGGKEDMVCTFEIRALG